MFQSISSPIKVIRQGIPIFQLLSQVLPQKIFSIFTLLTFHPKFQTNSHQTNIFLLNQLHLNLYLHLHLLLSFKWTKNNLLSYYRNVPLSQGLWNKNSSSNNSNKLIQITLKSWNLSFLAYILTKDNFSLQIAYFKSKLLVTACIIHESPNKKDKSF